MDPNAAADATAVEASADAAADAAAAVPELAPFIEPPSYDIDFKTTAVAIGILPSLHPQPSHANIRALE